MSYTDADFERDCQMTDAFTTGCQCARCEATRRIIADHNTLKARLEAAENVCEWVSKWHMNPDHRYKECPVCVGLRRWEGLKNDATSSCMD